MVNVGVWSGRWGRSVVVGVGGFGLLRLVVERGSDFRFVWVGLVLLPVVGWKAMVWQRLELKGVYLV